VDAAPVAPPYFALTPCEQRGAARLAAEQEHAALEFGGRPAAAAPMQKRNSENVAINFWKPAGKRR
jgi:hypothetical protein